jgi:HEAT repeat protein
MSRRDAATALWTLPDPESTPSLIEMYEHGERAMSDDVFLEQGIIGADPEHHVERIRSRAARRASGAGPDAIAISRAVHDQRSEARERRARSAGARDDSRAGSRAATSVAPRRERRTSLSGRYRA